MIQRRSVLHGNYKSRCTIYLSYIVFMFSFFTFLVADSLVCWLAFFYFARVFVAIYCMAESPCCIWRYLCLVVCDDRGRLSRRHRQGRIFVLDVDGWKYQCIEKNTHIIVFIAVARV